METHTHLRTQFEKETKLIFGMNINEYFLWLERKYLSIINKTADKCNVSEELTGFDIVGKKAEIIGNESGHDFKTGTVVNIDLYFMEDNDYSASSESDGWQLVRSDFKLLP